MTFSEKCMKKESQDAVYTQDSVHTQDAVRTQEWYTFKYLDFDCTKRLPQYFALKLL